ncbi:DivIVA domain-containing protein [Ethanoligenens harbinense]|uniref:Uncharacterized protein n=1 Tax=Ethanoligenens harbinense (strain DSM 18485 / JCM 12961 / CGMCC 1.5033 / YUAN-3) TaxID=663278 RepID=E6U8E4_ETHHY|nr:DivIVA domain-containing protein [Ethanoligenens harbinense]ADU28263.1 hypothetical protein Ethha_2771 [Ethanoligenens harbinense YUAN-3]AVQ97258.1 hypothetical protein CXQ68_14210 [Ethanoligenens harbinense YUAN-3]AYF39922.1 hypothetical protein CXP51_14110 [Ethanoligenens harbinense]AYF42752.1 hypothetical protein CN246_14690 [Ethanoligenens harbinense]QCN93502.1 hypothetical protein DRA42_14260 [Ethanoligenens harbinense]
MEGMFKTAVSGFKKDEVLAYIDKRETEARQKVESLNQRLRKMTADLNEEKTQHAEAVAQAEQLEAELARERERADELAKAAGTAEEEKRAVRAQLNDAQFEVARLRQELAAVQKEQERTQADKEKALLQTAELKSVVGELNDKIQNSANNEDRISRVLMEAQATADHILAEAQENASKQLADAQGKSAAVLDQARTELTELLRQTAQFRSEVSDLREGTQRAFSHIDTLLENVERSAGHIQEAYQKPFSPAVEPDEPPAVEESELAADEQAAASEQDEDAPSPETASTFNFSRVAE